MSARSEPGAPHAARAAGLNGSDLAASSWTASHDEGSRLVSRIEAPSATRSEIERLETLVRANALLLVEAGRRERQLALSQERLAFSQTAGRLGAWNLDLELMELHASDGCKDNFGRPRSDPFAYDEWIDAVHPDDRLKMQSAKASSVQRGSDYDIEYRITTPAGEVRWIQSRGQASYGPEGKPVSMTGISLDITNRKRAEEHSDLLAKELGHRIKNTLANVQSIVRQTLRHSASMSAAMETIDARLHALSVAHDVLMRETWNGATLTEVVAVALRPFGIEQHGRFTVHGPAILLPSRIALAFAMALHELATNAVKYGSLSGKVGAVALTWDVAEDAGIRLLRFRWRETGGPAVEPPTTTGFGSRLIGQVLAAEIGGTAKIDYDPDGVSFSAEAPLPATASPVVAV